MRATIARAGTLHETLTAETRAGLLAAFRDWRA